MKTMMKKIMFVCVLGVASQTQAAMYTTTEANAFAYGNLTWSTSFEYLPNATDANGDPITVAPPLGTADLNGAIWTGNNDLTVDPDEATNDQLEILGSNNNAFDPDDPNLFFPSESKMSAVADVDGKVTFDWVFKTLDSFGEFDLFMAVTKQGGAVIESTRLSNISASTQVGTQAGFGCEIEATCTGTFGNLISLSAGDLFSLSINTLDNGFGAATVDISNFSFTADSARVVPVPAAVWLFGSAMAGLGFMRKRKGLKVAV